MHECTQCCASFMSILVYFSQSGSCIWSPMADVQEQETVIFELGQSPLPTPAIPSLWDEFLQLILFTLELEGCGTLLLWQHRLWYFAAAEVGGNDCGFTWDVLKPPFHRNVYVRGNPVCQSTFHCRLVPELSLLHLSHHVWELNQNGTPLPTHRTYCLLWTC